MKSLKILLCGFIILTLTRCDSPNITKRHGLENLDTLLALQRSSSIETVSTYLDRFSGWKAYKNDTSYKAMWTNHPSVGKNAGNGYVIEIFKNNLNTSMAEKRPPYHFQLYISFTDDKLSTNYLNQIGNDSSYKLVNKYDYFGDEYQTYRKGDRYIEIRKMSKKYYLDIHAEDTDLLKHISIDPMFLTADAN